MRSIPLGIRLAALGMLWIPFAAGLPSLAQTPPPEGGARVTLGADLAVPGPSILADLDAAYGAGPFFTEVHTQLTALPAFGVTQSLRTGLAFENWSLAADVDLSLFPWSLTSAGCLVEAFSPTWVLGDGPRLEVSGTLGWGPRWDPDGGWSHRLDAGALADVVWQLPAAWGTTLEATLGSSLDVSWNPPAGLILLEWRIIVDAESTLPKPEDSPSTVWAGVTAQMEIAPAFGLQFDVRLEWRGEGVIAYVTAGAGEEGIRAQIGAEVSFGLEVMAYNLDAKDGE